jgi:hypothetical protein
MASANRPIRSRVGITIEINVSQSYARRNLRVSATALAKRIPRRNDIHCPDVEIVVENHLRRRRDRP